MSQNLAWSESQPSLSYAIVTPARDEEHNLRRLGSCLVEQTLPPVAWVVIDDGSTDASREVVTALAEDHPWIKVVASPPSKTVERGAPIVRAFHSALPKLEPLPDVVVKLDADISMSPDHFRGLLAEFERQPRLGIAGGAGYEEQADGTWRRRHGTGPSVWGACRAYRRECLDQILPLEEHMGWDTLDLMKAQLRGWDVKVFEPLPFLHHRAEGERDGHRLRTYIIQGEATHFMDYRPSYLALRMLFRLPRNPAAIGLLFGYARARLGGAKRCSDVELRAFVRRQQRLREIPVRAREAMRPRAALSEGE